MLTSPLRHVSSKPSDRMRTLRHQPLRNMIELADTRQVRALTKRLGISVAELRRISEIAGTSIAAITKEVELERAGVTLGK